MDNITLRIKALSRALFSLAALGCETADVSLAKHALKVEGVEPDGNKLVLHVWSTDAEETEAGVGRGERQLTDEETVWLDQGKCPVCEDHGQIYKGIKSGLALNVSCEAGHLFWVPPRPLAPEYCGVVEALPEPKADEVVESAVEKPDEKAEKESAEEAIKALEEGGEESGDEKPPEE